MMCGPFELRFPMIRTTRISSQKCILMMNLWLKSLRRLDLIRSISKFILEKAESRGSSNSRILRQPFRKPRLAYGNYGRQKAADSRRQVLCMFREQSDPVSRSMGHRQVQMYNYSKVEWTYRKRRAMMA